MDINARYVAMSQRTVHTEGIVHAHGNDQFTSRAFADIVLNARNMTPFGSVSEVRQNAVMGTFWSPRRSDVPNPKHWTTRVRLTNAMLGYTEVVHKRRHSKLGSAATGENGRTLDLRTA